MTNTKSIRWTRVLIMFVLAIALAINPGCNASRSAKGGAIGAAGGAVVGGAIGKATGNTALGAIIGAAVGGTAGALIGKRMDKQAEEIQQDLEGVEVERVGEGILLTFDSGLLFDTGKYDLKNATRENLTALSETLVKYEDTDILIEGHTDAVGTDENNQVLSENRANSVAGYLLGHGVTNERLIVKGYGESQPVADNETTEGKAANRRVEIAIFANKKMQKAAERGDLGEVKN